MYVIPSLTSKISDNNSSCSNYAYYITKETDGMLFNANKQEFEVEECIEIITKNANRGIRKNEAKWYSPTYSLSNDECIQIVNSILKYGTCESRNIENIDDLYKSELRDYNEKIKDLAILFQRNMAENFNKKDLGIKDEFDLCWYGSIEHTRKYKGYDREVINGDVKSKQEKKGFNTHIHIIQSRRGLNEKKSLLSPMARARNRTKQNIGFDRNLFFNKIEQTFDKFANYKRPQEQTFEHYKKVKKERISSIKQDKVTKEKYNYTDEFIDYKQSRETLKTSNCYQYFLELHERGLLNVEKKVKNKLIFSFKNDKDKKIIVSEKGYYIPNDYSSGGIVQAMQYFDNFNLIQSVSFLKSINSKDFDFDKIEIKKSIREQQKDNLYQIKGDIMKSKIKTENYIKRKR